METFVSRKKTMEVKRKTVRTTRTTYSSLPSTAAGTYTSHIHTSLHTTYTHTSTGWRSSMRPAEWRSNSTQTSSMPRHSGAITVINCEIFQNYGINYYLLVLKILLPTAIPSTPHLPNIPIRRSESLLLLLLLLLLPLLLLTLPLLVLLPLLLIIIRPLVLLLLLLLVVLTVLVL